MDTVGRDDEGRGNAVTRGVARGVEAVTGEAVTGGQVSHVIGSIR
jgi:hypothetical protein